MLSRRWFTLVATLLLVLLLSSSQVDAKKKKRRNKNSPFQPKAKQKFGSGEPRQDRPFQYTAENGYPNGKPWYLDDTVLNLAFASGIMFFIWLPNGMFRAPIPTGKKVTKEMYRKQA